MRSPSLSSATTSTAAPSGSMAPAIEASLDQAFFEGMDATLECLWRRYWVAELGVEKGVVLLARDVRLGGVPWPGAS